MILFASEYHELHPVAQAVIPIAICVFVLGFIFLAIKAGKEL